MCYYLCVLRWLMRPILALNCLLQIEQERSEEESSVGDALALAFRCARFCSASLILFESTCFIFNLLNKILYFIVNGEISVYLVKIKVVSITSELISYHFTSDWYDLYFHSSLWTTSVFFSVSEVDATPTSDFWTPLYTLFVSELNYQVLVYIFLVTM